LKTPIGVKQPVFAVESKLVSDKIYIGNDVWIAENCTILKGSIINDGAVIGAKSLVNSEIESYGIAVGVPAKVIKFRH
jgi:acetyltransferase-like isoleucine patch superfamily enzyme